MTKKIEVFASEALPGELEDFPDIKRGWGTTKESTGGIPPMKWFNAVQKRTDENINRLISSLSSDDGIENIGGGKAWVDNTDHIYITTLTAGGEIKSGWYTWLNERLYKIIGYDGIISSINGQVITLDNGKKSYLIDCSFHEGDVKAWGISKENNHNLNYELFQACIYHASGVSVDGIKTTASNLFNVKPRHRIYVSIDFKTKPVKILHTTKIYGLRGAGGQPLDDGIEFIIDSPSKGCFEFDPKNYCEDHTNQHYYGGVVKYLSVSVSGSESILSFVYANHSCGMEVSGNRAYGMEFLWVHNDGWSANIKNNVSNTSCGAFHLTRVTTGLAENNYCNYGGSGVGKIGFDYVLSGQIDASSRDLFTKSQHKYSRAVHSVSSNMDFITNTFEHWDIVRAMFSGSVGISSDYIEDIKVCVYATTSVSCTFKPLTIFLGSQENCVILQNNNISGEGRDDITVDLSNLTTNTSIIYGIGTPIYSGSNTMVILNAPFISLSSISNIGKYDGVKTVIQCDDELNVYCSSSGIEGSAGLNKSRPVKTVMEALNTAEIVSSSKVNIVILDDVYFTTPELAQIHYSKRNGITIRSTGKNIIWGNDLTNIPAIETEEITFDSVNITVPTTSVNRSKRNILRPITDARYNLKSCNLDLSAAFLIGDYTGTVKSVFLNLIETNQKNVTGGTIRNVPPENEKILLTYIRIGGEILGSDDGENIINVGRAVMSKN
ncbi:putative tail fiber protein [Proteus phage vB_PmiM_ZX7]|nr:putative tail fiber protein [Proteus phage vB_PmiM_ZX7]